MSKKRSAKASKRQSSKPSKTPFLDFLVYLTEHPGFSERLFRHIAGTLELVAGIDEKQAYAFLSGRMPLVKAALAAEAKKAAPQGVEALVEASPYKYPMKPFPVSNPGGP